jgi:hypothetical protein
MANRWVFLAALLTTVFIVAAAFTLPQLFFFDLAKSFVFMAVAVLVFFGEDRYGYMLGMIFPLMWFLIDILIGTFFDDFGVLFNYLSGKSLGPMETPLDGFARLAAVFLLVASFRSWKKEVPEKLVGKTFWVSLAISVGYLVVLTVWYYNLFPAGRHAG